MGLLAARLKLNRPVQALSVLHVLLEMLLKVLLATVLWIHGRRAWEAPAPGVEHRQLTLHRCRRLKLIRIARAGPSGRLRQRFHGAIKPRLCWLSAGELDKPRLYSCAVDMTLWVSWCGSSSQTYGHQRVKQCPEDQRQQ